MARTYENFDVELVASGTTYEARFRSLPGEPTITIDFPLEESEFASFLGMFGKQQRRRMESPEFSRVRAVGSRLFDCLFPNELRASWVDVANQAKRNGKGIRIRIDLSQAEDLVTIPWEYLYRVESDDFLSLSNWTPVVRFLDVAEPLGAMPLKGPLKILVMISDPIERRGTLDVDREWQQLNEALAGPISRNEIQLHLLPNGQLEALQVALQQSDYHVFHFIGHGEYSEEYDDGVLALEDARGRESHVSGSSLGTYLRDCLPLRLVVLNNCEGAATSESDPFAGSAQSLLRQGIPAIVAMQFEITDRAAIDFARGFYTSIGNGFPVDAALAEARKVISGGPTRIEFGSPVLYLSANDGMVFTTEIAPDIPDETPTDLTIGPSDGKTLEGAEGLLVATQLGPLEEVAGEVRGQSVDDSEVDTVEIEGLEDPRVPATDLPEEITDSESEAPVVGEGEAVAAPPIEKAEPDATVTDEDRAGRGGSEKSKRLALIGSMVLGGLILIALIVRFLPDDGGAEVTTTPSVSTTPSASTTPSVTIAPAVPSPFVDWSRVLGEEPTLGGVGNQVMYDVTADGPSLVAVGKGADGRAAVWTSAGGVDLTRVPDLAVNGETSERTEMRAVVSMGSSLFAVGWAGPAGEEDAAVWTSDDGNSWSRVPDASGALGGIDSQAMRSVTVWKSGLVAVGWEDPADLPIDGVVWTSPDGLAWTRVKDPEGVFGGASHQHVHDVVAGGPGLVAVGGDQSQGDTDVAIWTSVDGAIWNRVSSEQSGMSGPGDQLANSVRVGEMGLVAGGFYDTDQDDLNAALWRSADGDAWSLVTQPDDVFGGPDLQEIHGLAAVGSGFVATGWVGSDDNRDAAIWVTSDGTTWARVDDEQGVLGGQGRQQIESVTLDGLRLVAVGLEELEADESAAVWLGTP